MFKPKWGGGRGDGLQLPILIGIEICTLWLNLILPTIIYFAMMPCKSVIFMIPISENHEVKLFARRCGSAVVEYARRNILNYGVTSKCFSCFFSACLNMFEIHAGGNTTYKKQPCIQYAA